MIALFDFPGTISQLQPQEGRLIAHYDEVFQQDNLLSAMPSGQMAALIPSFDRPLLVSIRLLHLKE